MLGRHHLSISLAIASLIVIPLIFIQNGNFLGLGIAFIVAVMVGSLTPDSDCGGKTKIYYDFYLVDRAMNIIVQPIVKFVFKNIVSRKYDLECQIKDEHRGIMHSPSGIIISSFILTILLTAIIVLLELFSIRFTLAFFFGLMLGQFLHLIEDSCTISGINWKFPFNNSGEMKGSIFTWDKYRKDNKTDIRPGFFSVLFWIIAICFLVVYALGNVNLSIFLLYTLVILTIVLEIFIMLLISGVFSKKKDASSIWIQNKDHVKTLKRHSRKFIRNQEF